MKKNTSPYFLRFLICCFSVILYTQPLHAVTRNVPGTYATIQTALNAAASGDIVLVQPGTYAENLTWPNINNISLVSAGTPSNTSINGNNTGRVIYFYNLGAKLTGAIRGFTIENGLITGANAYGGGIHTRGFDLTMDNLVFQNNIASGTTRSYGGGLYAYDGSSIVISNTLFLSNQSNTVASGSWSYGGGLWISTGGKLDLENVLFEKNICANDDRTYGAAIYASGVTGTWTNLKLQENECQLASWAGAAVMIDNGSVITINSVANSNNITQATNWSYGGAFRIISSNVTINKMSSGCNSARAGTWAFAGGIYVEGAVGLPASFTITNGIVAGNQLSGTNTWTYGCGMYVREYSNVNLTNCTFGDNAYTGTGPAPGGVAILSGTTGNAIASTNCIFYDPPSAGPELGGGGYTVNFSDIRGGFAGTANVNLNPNWVGSNDFHFTITSPLAVVDGGTVAGAAIDLDGNSRPFGAAYAMGAYEEGYAVAETACDVNILLPINNIQFNANLNQDKVILDWTTFMEINSDYFEIERSIDAISFERIAQVNAAGHSTYPLQYSVIDYQPYLGNSYYRLKSFDLDGTYRYSDIKSISINSTPNFLLYPLLWGNDVQEVKLYASIEDQINVEVFSILGQELIRSKEYKITPNTITTINLPIGNLANGNYLVRIKGKQLNFVRQVVIGK